VACRVLGVSRSGYDDWLGRPPCARDEANSLLLKHSQQVHAESRGTYGWPRVHAELTLGLGLPVNHKRVARLMRQAGCQGLYRRRYRRGPTGPATEGDLVGRRFTVDAPNRLWLTDITEHPTREGKLYCAAVMDAYVRLIVGWSIADHLRTELVVDALGMATLRRRPSRRFNDPALRPRNSIYFLGVRATTPCRRIAAIDGHYRRLLRQFHDGVFLGNSATRSPRHQDLGNPR
jgi:putative transposase